MPVGSGGLIRLWTSFKPGSTTTYALRPCYDLLRLPALVCTARCAQQYLCSHLLCEDQDPEGCKACCGPTLRCVLASRFTDGLSACPSVRCAAAGARLDCKQQFACRYHTRGVFEHGACALHSISKASMSRSARSICQQVAVCDQSFIKKSVSIALQALTTDNVSAFCGLLSDGPTYALTRLRTAFGAPCQML